MYGMSVSVCSDAMVAGAPYADFTAEDSGSIYINNLVDEGCGDDSDLWSRDTSPPSYYPTYFPSYYPTTDVRRKP